MYGEQNSSNLFLKKTAKATCLQSNYCYFVAQLNLANIFIQGLTLYVIEGFLLAVMLTLYNQLHLNFFFKLKTCLYYCD